MPSSTYDFSFSSIAFLCSMQNPKTKLMSDGRMSPTSPGPTTRILAERPTPTAAPSAVPTALKGAFRHEIQHGFEFCLKIHSILIRYVSNSGCDECRCYEPCRGYSCPEGTQCQAELVSDPVDPDRPEQGSVTRVQPTCRPLTKEGRCPSVQRITGGRSSSCEEECRSDADCGGDYKCCFNGCGRSCFSPHSSGETPVVATTPYPVRGAKLSSSSNSHRKKFKQNVGRHAGGSPPRIVDGETRAMGEEGTVASLRCEATGSPAPTIYWRRGNEEVDAHLIFSNIKIFGLHFPL